MNKTHVAVALALLAASALANATDADLLLINAKLVDVEQGRFLAQHAVAIKDGRIAALPDDAAVADFDATQVVDLEGQYVIPGLWDMHVHFEGQDLVEDNALLFPVYLAYGITAVRDAASDLGEQVIRWRNEINQGLRVGPRIFTAGRKFEGIDSIWKGDLEIGNTQQLQDGMAYLDKLGVDFIKITDNTLSPDLFLEVVKQAHRRGRISSGHPPLGLSLQTLAENGFSSIEHATYVLRLGNKDEPAIAAQVRAGTLAANQAEVIYQRDFDQQQGMNGYRMLAKHDVAVTPTLIGGRQLAWLHETDHSRDGFLAFLTKAFSDNYQWRIGRMAGETAQQRQASKDRYALTARQLPYLQQAGVRILAGSDSAALNTYVYPALALHQELQLFADAGLSPAEILRTATVNGARFMHQWQHYGSIATGKVADLVILQKDPLQDIRATLSIDGLIHAGHWFSRQQLDAILENAKLGKQELDRRRASRG